MMMDYKAPGWATENIPVEHIPTKRLELSMRPTPIRPWNLPGSPEGYQIMIKRDDMTGSSLTGNKVRKLEFMLADALEKGCKHIITWGSFQSNHCRATAVACAELGLQCHMFVGTDITDTADIKYEGNLLLGKLCGVQLYLLPNKPTYAETLQQARNRMAQLAEKIREERGEDSYTLPEEAYPIPFDDSTPLGNWGYLSCFEEIRTQGVEFDDLVLAGGGGATAAGLAIANHLCGSPYSIHCIFACEGIEVFQDYVNRSLHAYKLPENFSYKDVMTIYEDYQYPSYGQNYPEQLEFIAQTAKQTGILLDNCYTGKAAYGLQQLLLNKPEVFKGRRILFLHSGGIHSLQCENVKTTMLAKCSPTNITMLPKE